MLNLEELIDPGFLKSEGLMDPPAPTLDTILAVEELTDTISGYEDSKRELAQLDRKFDEADEQATKLEIIQDTVAKFGFTRSTYRLALWNPFVAKQTAMFPGVEDISLADRPDSIQASAAMESFAQVVTTIWDFIRQLLLQIKHALTKFFHFWSLRAFFYRRRIESIRKKMQGKQSISIDENTSLNLLKRSVIVNYRDALNGKIGGGSATLLDSLFSAGYQFEYDDKGKSETSPRFKDTTAAMTTNMQVITIIVEVCEHFDIVAKGGKSIYLPSVADIVAGDPNGRCAKLKRVASILKRRLDEAWEQRPERVEIDVAHNQNAFQLFMSGIDGYGSKNIALDLCDLARMLLDQHNASANSDIKVSAFNSCAKMIDTLLAASRKYQFAEKTDERTQELAKKFRETAEGYRKLASCITTFADHHLWWVKETVHAAEEFSKLYN